LTSTAFVLPRFPRDPARYHDDLCPSKSASIEVYQTCRDASHPSYPRPRLLATFMLPSMYNRVQAHALLSRSGAPPTRHYHYSPQRPQPFHVVPENRILSFYFVWEAPHSDSVLIIHCSTLLQFKKFLPGSLADGCSRCIPWEEWGPANTRWIEACCDSHEYAVYGSRFAHQVYFNRFFGCGKICVLDFNPYVVERGGAEGISQEDIGDEESEYSEARCRSVTSPTVIAKGSLFVEDVLSLLPYRETLKNVSCKEDSIIVMDKEHIVLLKEEEAFEFYAL